MLRRYGLLLIALFYANSTLAYPCAKPEEMEAIHVRALQTELMMAGLSCNGKRHYSNFVRKNQRELKEYAQSMRGYFVRNFGGNAESKMDEFVTALANESSKKSMQTGQKSFCSNANNLFKAVATSSTIPYTQYRYHGDIRQCFW